MSADNFAEQLLAQVLNYKNESEGDVVVNAQEKDSTNTLSTMLIKHWLNFAVYYERAAVLFIGQWLQTTYEDDAFVHFAHQIEDEANHYRWLKQHLLKYSSRAAEFSPPAEWRFLMEEYYPKLPTLIERLAAHNIAAETGALGFAEYYFDRFPVEIQQTLTKVVKDERYHISFGKSLLNKYCCSQADRELATAAAHESLAYMQKARSVFVKI